MHHLVLDMYMTAGVGVLALFLGFFFTRKIPVLKRMCIPVPVSGGLLISLLMLLCHSAFGIEFTFDGTVKDLCMLLFFTSVGFQSNIKILKQGGRPLLVMIGLVFLLIVMQNLLSLGIAKGLGISPLIGMAAGSIPMSGGHGTAGGFAPVLEQMGLSGASAITMAAATFGLVAGSLIGGPLGGFIIEKHKLSQEGHNEDPVVGAEADEAMREKNYLLGACQLILAMAIGMGLSRLLSMTGITFPTYFGSLLVGAIIRNVFDPDGKDGTWAIHINEIIALGDICLSLFLGMAMSTLKLWELSGMVLPLLIILFAQATFIILYGAFVAFPALGRDYDAAVLVSGICGFGLGATPNAMANMSAVCFKYHYSVKPFIIIPIMGAMFADIINTGVITVFLNLI